MKELALIPRRTQGFIRFNKAYNIKNRYPDMDWFENSYGM